ncbi:Plug domain-containing protein, partial [Acinetobacter baumannii]
GRDRVERYRGSNPDDVVKDLVGVFSGDARNSGALDVTIRRIQGPGRVPVSIDGGEEALTVWRGYNGVSNRNYIDPNLIGGIQVIKG